MSFQLKRSERVPDGVRRIVRERIDRAVKALDDNNGKVSDARIHEARRQLKEVRATLRLVRNDLGASVFGRGNRTFRDVARLLSRCAMQGYRSTVLTVCSSISRRAWRSRASQDSGRCSLTATAGGPEESLRAGPACHEGRDGRTYSQRIP